MKWSGPNRVGLAALILAYAAPQAAMGQARWVEVRSANFVVQSNAGEARAREIAAQFERIRAAFRAAFGDAAVKDPRVPVTVVAAADEATFVPMLPREWAGESVRRPAGIFLKTPDRYYVLLRADLRGEQAYQLVYHEYFHAFAALNLPALPVWLSEGWADFYAGTVIRAEEVVRGAGLLRHKVLLREAQLLPMRDLLRASSNSPLYSDAKRAPLFYAQAWALVHMLELGEAARAKGDENAALGGLREMLRAARTAADVARLQSAMLEHAALLERRLAAYVRRGSYPSLHLEQAAPFETGIATARTLTEAEGQVALAQYYLAAGRIREARGLMEEVARTAADTPGAHDAFGQVMLKRGEMGGAWAEFSRAVFLGSRDWRTHYSLAMILAPGVSKPEEVKQVEDLLRRAVELNPDSPEAASALAGMLLDAGRDAEFAVTLARRAAELEPESDAQKFLLARALLKAGDRDAARVAAQQALNLASAEPVKANLREYLKALDKPVAPPEPAAYYSTVREVVIWQKDEAAEEALRRWKAERDAVAHIQTFVSGRVLRVACAAKPRLDLELETETGTLKLRALDSGVVAYYVAQGAPPRKFEPCADLRGRAVEIVYRPTPKSSVAGEILAVEMNR